MLGPPFFAVLPDARHYLHVITWTVEVLMARAGVHGLQFFDDLSLSFLCTLPHELCSVSSDQPYISG
jgi:hypothetical protein